MGLFTALGQQDRPHRTELTERFPRSCITWARSCDCARIAIVEAPAVAMQSSMGRRPAWRCIAAIDGGSRRRKVPSMALASPGHASILNTDKARCSRKSNGPICGRFGESSSGDARRAYAIRARELSLSPLFSSWKFRQELSGCFLSAAKNPTGERVRRGSQTWLATVTRPLCPLHVRYTW